MENSSPRIIVPSTDNRLGEAQMIQISSSLNPSQSTTTTSYTVTSFDDHCEDFSRIQSLVTLNYSTAKIVLFILLNIVTGFLINLIMMWFPKLQLYLLYSASPIKQAKFIGVYGTDNIFYVIPLSKLQLPSICDSAIRKHCQLNINPQAKETIMFTFKLFKYVYDEGSNAFTAFQFDIKLNQDTLIMNLTNGLNKTEVNHQKMLFGVCDLLIDIPSIIKLIITEFSDPFYVFQLFSVILWYCNQYAYYASVIIIATIVSLTISVYESRTSLVSIQAMAKYVCKVNVFRRKSLTNGNGNDNDNDKTMINIRSTELIPGDLFEIPDDNYALPCDCILINGTVIVNESMLTGESTPIIKNHMQIAPIPFDSDIDSKHVLFAGTKIVQKRSLNHQKVIAVVYRIGFETVKGNLIRSILFPKEIEKNFKADSVKYIIVMSVLCLIGFFISLPFLLTNAGLDNVEVVLKFLDLFTTTVPPALPTCLGVGVSYALSRLYAAKIICINRERVNIVGKITTIVFDKTGTLTEDHLDISGYRPNTIKGKNTFAFDDFKDNMDGYMKDTFAYYKSTQKGKNKPQDLKQLFIECLASCHGITIVKGKLIGDPIDVKMFLGSGWILKENTENNNNYDSLVLAYVRPKNEQDMQVKLKAINNNNNGEHMNISNADSEDRILDSHYELGIVRRFDFSSKLQRMTTIVKDSHDNFFKVFCKGSPEKVIELCKSETIPSNFNELLASYTSRGLRVLALSTKLIKMDFTQSQKVSQSFVEKNMIFLGLLIVQNKLKTATPSSIELLDKAHLQMIMATGDNILTAISVSKDCKIIPKQALIYTCELVQDNNEGQGKEANLIWQPVEFLGDNEQVNKENAQLLLKEDNYNENSIGGLYEQYPPEEFYDEKTTINDTENLILIDNTVGGIVRLNNQQEQQGQLLQQQQGAIFNRRISETINISTAQTPFHSMIPGQYVLAITGTTFESLLKKKKLYTTTSNPAYRPHYDAFMTILRHCYIYARMAPEHKTLLIENLREQSLNVLMCGDGANDCGALRAADVGVSLSPEEASIAAHFTSKVPDISCLITLLREGKASLVTSIQTFKYMMMYSFIQFFSVTLLMIYWSYLSDSQFLTSDIFIIFPLAFFIAQTDSYPHLTSDIPESSLLSVPILSSIFIHMCITFLFQIGGVLILGATKWHVNTCELAGNTVFPCSDNSVLFLISNMQYLTSAIAFSMSKPYRKPIFTNYWLMGYLFIAFFISLYIIIAPAGWTKSLLVIADFEDGVFKYYVLIMTLVNFLLSYLIEKLIVPLIENCYRNGQIKRLSREMNGKVKKMVMDKYGFEKEIVYTLEQYQRVTNYERTEREKKIEKQMKNKKKKYYDKRDNGDGNNNNNNNNQIRQEEIEMAHIA